MKTKIIIYTIIAFLSTFSQVLKAQDKLNLGVNELEITYAEDYDIPKKVEIIFAGNPSYINYFYSDLEQKIKKEFSKKKIDIVLRYSDKKPHFKSKSTSDDVQISLFLTIDNSIVIDEKGGYNRLMTFDFEGKLIDQNSDAELLNFKTIISCLHDITSENKAIIKYLLSKITKK